MDRVPALYRTVGFLKTSVGRFDRGVLLLDHLRQDSQSRQVIFHLLEGCQHRLPVIRDGLIVGCLDTAGP